MHLRSGLYCPQRVYISTARPTVKRPVPARACAITSPMPARKSSRRCSSRRAHGFRLQRHRAHRNSQFLNARPLTGRQHRGHVLKLAAGVAAHQDAQIAILPPGGRQPRRQFVERDDRSVQRDGAVAKDVDLFAGGGRA